MLRFEMTAALGHGLTTMGYIRYMEIMEKKMEATRKGSIGFKGSGVRA